MSAKLADFEVPLPRRFSRQWWAQRLRMFAWVAVITLLIWVYADITKTEEADIDLSVRLQVGSTGNMVLLAPTGDVAIRARVRARRHAIDRLANRNESLIFDASKLTLKTRQLDAAALLSELPQISKIGVTILSARPGTINIKLDPLVGVDVPVKLQATGGDTKDEKTRPERIRLFVPDSYKNQVEEESFALLTAPVDVSNLPAEKSHEIDNVEVRTPESIPGCRLETKTVNVSFFKLRRQIVTKKFKVPLAVLSPHTWHSDNTWVLYQLETEGLELTKEITVTANPIDMEKLRAEDIRACIILTEDDKRQAGHWIEPQVRILFPEDPELNVKDLEVVVPGVKCRLVLRPKAPPAS